MSSDETFVGPVVQVFLEPPARGAMLEDVHLRRLAGRDFLVGKLASRDPSDQRAGREVWCAMDHVQMMIHFPDLAAAQSYYAANIRQKSAKSWRLWRK
jgi:hypothetical protein